VNSRGLKLTQGAIDALKGHRKCQYEDRLRLGTLWQDTGLVFTTATGTPMDGDNLAKRSFGPLLTRAGLPRIRFHDLRHTFATVLLSRGTHPKIAQEMLGHANISQTLDTYSHVLPDMQGEAVSTLDRALF
jgi:integrase